MGTPRRILPGGYWFVTRRCTQRYFLLRPDGTTNGVFMYCLAEAAARFGIRVIGITVSSNHYHGVFYDPAARLPAFLGHLHKMVAAVMNRRWRRRENFWAAEPTCSARCIQQADVFDKLIYTLANPVKDQLVDKVVNWPGASSLRPQLLDKEPIFERPRIFFSKSGRMPEHARIRFMRPVGFEKLTHREWVAKIQRSLQAVEAAAAAARQASGRRILGRKAVLSQSIYSAPTSPRRRGGLRPRIACRSRVHRIEALQHELEFWQRYKAALKKLAGGVRDVLFPPGTYQLRVRNLGLCEPFPAPS